MTPRLEGALWGTLRDLPANNRMIEKEGEGNWEKKVSKEKEEEHLRLPNPKGQLL